MNIRNLENVEDYVYVNIRNHAIVGDSALINVKPRDSVRVLALVLEIMQVVVSGDEYFGKYINPLNVKRQYRVKRPCTVNGPCTVKRP